MRRFVASSVTDDPKALAFYALLGLAGCTERPSSFPACLDPYDNFANDCPAIDADASGDGGSSDGADASGDGGSSDGADASDDGAGAAGDATGAGDG